MSNMEGWDSLQKKLRMLANPTKPIRKGMQDFMGFIEKKIEPYPPLTQANRKPGINGYSWYERGFGVRTVTGKAYKTSGFMNRRWDYDTKIRGNGVRGTITNLADYSIYVQGELQARYHAARGWTRADKEVVKNGKVFVRFVGKEIDRELNR